MKPYRTPFEAFLCPILKERNIKASGFEKLLGVGDGHLARVFAGKLGLGITMPRRIASVLGLPPSDFVPFVTEQCKHRSPVETLLYPILLEKGLSRDALERMAGTGKTLNNIFIGRAALVPHIAEKIIKALDLPEDFLAHLVLMPAISPIKPFKGTRAYFKNTDASISRKPKTSEELLAEAKARTEAQKLRKAESSALWRVSKMENPDYVGTFGGKSQGCKMAVKLRHARDKAVENRAKSGKAEWGTEAHREKLTLRQQEAEMLKRIQASPVKLIDDPCPLDLPKDGCCKFPLRSRWCNVPIDVLAVYCAEHEDVCYTRRASKYQNPKIMKSL